MRINVMTKRPKLPIILYEEDLPGQKGSPIPYIETSETDDMPPVLFIFEYKDSGEVEPGQKGESLSIVDQIPHQFIDLKYIQERISPELFDKLRVALDMLPLKEAQKKGNEILDKVYKNLQDIGLPVESVTKK